MLKDSITNVSTHALELELNKRYENRRTLIAIKQFEHATGKEVQQATTTELDGLTTIILELK